MSNPSAESPQSMRYFFPPRAEVFRKGEDERDPQRIRFRLFWGQFIRHAAQKAPIDPDTAHALDLFSQIEFHVSQETWDRLEDMLSTAVSLSENPLLPKPISVMGHCESAAIAYFDALYSPENHSSQVHPATLRMIAKYLFAVKNLPLRRAQAFAGAYPEILLAGAVGSAQRDFHKKAIDAICAHYSAWAKAEEAAPESREKEEAPAEPQQSMQVFVPPRGILYASGPNLPAEPPQSIQYFFPPRSVNAQDGEASNPPRIRFRLLWGQFIRHAAQKAPIDPDTAYALDLFSQIEFHVSQETWDRLKNVLSPSNVFWGGEAAAAEYFDALYSPENHSSQVHPATLRMIAKYLFAVKNLPLRRAQAFAETCPRRHIGFGEKSHHALHEKASAAISDHWWAWYTGKGEASAPESREKEEAPAPEAPAASHKKVPYTKFPLVVWSGATQQKETRTFYLHWHRLIEEAQAKHPLDKETRDALVLFNKILFTVPKETFEQLEALKKRAKQLSETPSAVEIYGVREEEIAVGKYFHALYSSENHDSQVAPTTLRKIAKYLFAVCHFPDEALDFATALDFPLDANIYSDSVPDNLLRQIHWKASEKIRTHWFAFNNQDNSPKPLEYAQAPETPVAPAEEPAFPDVESIMVSAFADFEKGKSLTEVGGLICDAVGLRELYEEQLEDPKNRAILALGEGLIRSLGTLLRPNREKPFVMTPPVGDTARPIQPSDPIAARPPKKMGEVVAEMLQRQREEAEAQKKKDEIAEAFRQREEAIRQAKEAADAKFQAEVVRVNGSPAAPQNDATPDDDGMAQFRKRIVYNADGAWLPLNGGGRKVTGEQQLKNMIDEILAAPGDAWEEARRQVAKGDRPLAQILADLRERQNIASLEAKEAEERELSEKIREHFAGKGEGFVAQLRQRIKRRENKSN